MVVLFVGFVVVEPTSGRCVVVVMTVQAGVVVLGLSDVVELRGSLLVGASDVAGLLLDVVTLGLLVVVDSGRLVVVVVLVGRLVVVVVADGLQDGRVVVL